MDRGEFIKNGYTVEPGDGGSFVVTEGGHKFSNSEDGKWRIRQWRGFTTYQDLIKWLDGEHRANSQVDAAGHPLPDSMRKGDEWRDLRDR